MREREKRHGPGRAREVSRTVPGCCHVKILVKLMAGTTRELNCAMLGNRLEWCWWGHVFRLLYPVGLTAVSVLLMLLAAAALSKSQPVRGASGWGEGRVQWLAPQQKSKEVFARVKKMYNSTYTYTPTHKNKHSHMHTHTHIFVCVCAHVSVSLSIFVHLHTRTHTRTHAHTHAHTHTSISLSGYLSV